jgi:putative Ca2+/H+ antiporter (TMEM165/GDT1 family)
MEVFLISASTVAIAEFGDRTQLLALILGAHFRRPWPILLGVLCATLVSHAAAAVIGLQLGRFLTPTLLNGIVGVSMVGMALWTLKGESSDEDDDSTAPRHSSAFVAAAVMFFVSELGDKTQIATAALAAGYSNLTAVVAGATGGMLLVNVPVVFIGSTFSGKLPLTAIRYVASALFLLLGGFFIFRALANT